MANFYGRCYWGSEYIAAHIPDPSILRKVYAGAVGNGYLGWPACSWEEAVVALVAHEIRHLWQARHPKGWRVWGARGRMSERDADAYAIRKLREWRRSRPPRKVVPLKGTSLARFRILAVAP